MITEYTLNGDEVLIQDNRVKDLITRQNYQNIEKDFALNNRLEILENKRAQKIGKLNRLRDNFKNSKEIKSTTLLVSLISLALITLLDAIATHIFPTILIDFLINAFVLGSFNVLVRIFLNKFNSKNYFESENTLNNEISYLNQEIAKVSQRKNSLNCNQKNFTKTMVKKSLVEYNTEQELLIDAKLQLITEYQKRKSEYIDNFNKGTLKSLVKDQDEEQLIRELVLKDIKNNKN